MFLLLGLRSNLRAIRHRAESIIRPGGVSMDHDPRWYENEDFWRELRPMFFNPERWASTVDQVDKIVELLDLQPGARILDLCCGPGRHSLEFARRGYFVTGIDRTAEYLDEARASADKEGLSIEFKQIDMRDFRDESAFDAALNIFTSFGYFDNPEDDRRVIENISASLRVHGKCVIDTIGKEVVARNFRQSDWHRDGDGTIIIEERSICEDWSRINNTWTIIRDGNQKEFEFTLRCYSAVELASLLTEGGFSNVNCYGGLSGNCYDHEASRLVVVGEK